MELIQPTAALQLKYDYDQLDLDAATTTRCAAIEIKTHAERAKSSMIFIGKLLADVKALLPHGQFEDWCRVEFEMSQRTAQRMMAAAEVFGDKSDTVSLLSDSVMYMLSAPSVPEAARVEVIEQAKETGTSPTKAEVQAVLDKHKPDEELRSKCHKIEFWLMGKSWSGFGYKRDGEHVSGIQKGEHRFVWLDDDWRDRYEKVKAAEKIERTAIAEFIKLKPPPPKNDTVSPSTSESPAPTPPETEEERSNRIRQKLCDDMDGYLARKFAAGSPQPDYTSEEDDAAEKANKSSSSMGTPTAIILELPPIPFPDKDLLLNQVKRAVGILNEEGFATAADLLRVAGRCAYDAQSAQPAAPTWVAGEPYEKTGGAKPSRKFMIDLTTKVFKSAMDSLDEYGQLTGHFTDIPPAQRILERIIKNLQDNLT